MHHLPDSGPLQKREDDPHYALRVRSIQDRRLNLRARGLLATLLSLPDGAPISAERIQAEMDDGEGRDAIRAALSDLEDAGYLVRTRTQTPRGRWVTFHTVAGAPIFDVSAGQTEDGPPGVGPPGVGKPGGKNKREKSKAQKLSSETEQKLNRLENEGQGTVVRASKVRAPSTTTADERFDEFWKVYPRKVGKGAARRRFRDRVKQGADPDELIAAAGTFAAWCVAAAECGELESMKFVPHPATWLYQERDQDTLNTPGRVPAARGRLARSEAERRMNGTPPPPPGSRLAGAKVDGYDRRG